MRRHLHPLFWFVGLPLLIAGGIVVAQFVDILFIHKRTPDRLLIPEGYKGRVRVWFSVPGTPALPLQDRHLIFRINPDGTLTTSSRFKQGWKKDDYAWATDQYFYFSENHLTPLRVTDECGSGTIWGQKFGIDGGSTDMNFLRFYVGTESDYRHETNPTGRIYKSCP